MTLWFSEIPSWLSLVIVVAIANALAIGAALVVRRRYHRSGVAEGPSVVSAWGSVAGALGSLLFAFTIITLWNASTRAVANVDTEAGAIRIVARDIAPSQLPMLRDYTKRAIGEWPRLCAGTEDPAVAAALVKLERLAKPRSEAYATDLYTQLDVLQDMRSRRWQSAIQSVPDEIWVALVVVSLTIFVVLAVAMPARLSTHVALMATIATAVGTLVWVATVLEYPFCGSAAIGPAELLNSALTHLF